MPRLTEQQKEALQNLTDAARQFAHPSVQGDAIQDVDGVLKKWKEATDLGIPLRRARAALRRGLESDRNSSRRTNKKD